MTQRINIKLQGTTEYDGETYHQVIAEYFPKESGRAARATHFVRAGESFDLHVPPPELQELSPEDRALLDRLARKQRP